jgi:hypothetical protein
MYCLVNKGQTSVKYNNVLKNDDVTLLKLLKRIRLKQVITSENWKIMECASNSCATLPAYTLVSTANKTFLA